MLLRDYLERQLIEHRDVIDQTLLRIFKSPQQLPRLLALYARTNLEIAPPAALIEVQLEEESRERYLVERATQQAQRQAQLAATANGPATIYKFVEPTPPVEATPSPAVDVPLSLHPPAVEEEPPPRSESPQSPPRSHPMPPMPRAREELEALRQSRHNGGS